jgi:SAM-dependent methyltransferase
MSRFADIKLGILHQIARAAYRIPRLSFEARLIEYHFARASIDENDGRKRILDVGCCGSKLPVELAKRGHEVFGLDVGTYPDAETFTFVQGDIGEMPFDNDSFDVVTAVSTIEHIGLGRYGDPIAPEGDTKAVEEITRVLKQGGQLIVTIPCGMDTICYSKDGVPLSRVYSSASLLKLLAGFEISEMAYIVKSKMVWFPASAMDAERVVKRALPEKTGMTAIALIAARKGTI